MPTKSISLAAARRISLAAQGFARSRPSAKINAGHIGRVIRRLGLLQLDYVNVLVPAHNLVVYSRLGAYDRDAFHRVVYRGTDFTEHWAHEASIVPASLWPLLQYRREDYRPYPNSPLTKLANQSRYLSQVSEIIKNKAPLTSADLPAVSAPRRRPGDWQRSLPRWALEYHFGKGSVAVADRLPNFQRVYDLPERLIDSEHLERRVPRPEAQRELLRIAAKAFGIATLDDLADYFRMPSSVAGEAVKDLVEEGFLREVQVESWGKPAFLARGARLPRKVTASALISPFDPLVWYRPRADRLFDFQYKIEIYVPAAKRKWGYYVLPYLLDDRIAARVDLKADRKARTLRVLAAHAEPCTDKQRTARHLAAELDSLASWLNLERIEVSRRGSLARDLRHSVRPTVSH